MSKHGSSSGSSHRSLEGDPECGIKATTVLFLITEGSEDSTASMTVLS